MNICKEDYTTEELEAYGFPFSLVALSNDAPQCIIRPYTKKQNF